MSLLTDLVIRLPDLNNVERERLARELERIRVLASKDSPTEPVNVHQSGNPQYVSLGGETNDVLLWSGADLIIYSDTGTTEKGRWDGATGNITTAGTVDGVDVAGANAAQYVTIVADGNIANERVLTGTSNQIVVTDNGAGSTVVLSTPQNIHTGAGPTFASLDITNNITVGGTVDSIDIAGAAAAEYVCISGDANIANERILAGTANQIVVTDNGAGSTVVLSTPQDIHTAATPTFGGIIIADGGTIGQAAGPLLTFDDTNNQLEISGCAVGINTPNPRQLFEIHKTAWDQTFDEEIADFDAVSPAWDKEVDAVGDFDAETDGDGDLNVLAVGHDGAGIEITFDDANAAYGTANADAVDNTTGVVSCWFSRNDMVMGSGKLMYVVSVDGGVSTVNWVIQVKNNGGVYQVGVASRDDAGTLVDSAWTTLAAAWTHFLLLFKASTGVGNDDGVMYFYVNGELVVLETGRDNDTRDWDVVRVGMVATNDTTFGGSFYFDTIKIDPVGAPQVDTLAVKNGTYGLAVPVMDSTERYGEFTDPTAETISTGEKWFNPNTITMAENDAYDFMYSPGEWAVSCVKSATAYTIKLTVDKDAGTSVTSAYEITDDWHLIRAQVASATGAGTNDGYGFLYIDGVLQEALAGIDNDTKSVGEVRYGIRNADAGTYGIFYMDDCKWRGGDGVAITGDGVMDFRGSGDSAKAPQTVAPDDWVEVKIEGTTYYLPAYAAS